MRIRSLVAVFAAAAALTLGTTLPAGAVVRPAEGQDCLINIGQPGNVKIYGEYAGQAEQEYNTCDGTVWAHWQWAGAFQAHHPYSHVVVGVESGYPGGGYWKSGPAPTSQKDVWFAGPNHSLPTPDAWRSWAAVDAGCSALGTLHWYGGADWDGPFDSRC